MSRGVRSFVLACAMLILLVLHQDDWLAGNPQRILGLPASLAWHLGLCLVATGVLYLAVRLAWPVELDEQDRGSDPS